MKDANKKKPNDKVPKWFVGLLAFVIFGAIGGSMYWAMAEEDANRARYAVEWAADQKVRAEKRRVEEERAKLNETFQREQLKRWKKEDERP